MQRLMLVDDEPHVLSALKRVLRFGAGVQVQAFDDPRQALARMESTAFDVVVSDYRMPPMNGVEFLTRARRVQPHAVRLMLTASCDVATLLRAVNEVELFRYLLKPWQSEELSALVRLALERARQAREEREMADAMRLQTGEISAAQRELRRLEALEPGITHVDWGPNGEVLMPPLSV